MYLEGEGDGLLEERFFGVVSNFFESLTYFVLYNTPSSSFKDIWLLPRLLVEPRAAQPLLEPKGRFLVEID